MKIDLIQRGSAPTFRIASDSNQAPKVRGFQLWDVEAKQPLWWVVSGPSEQGDWFTPSGSVVRSQPVLVGGTHKPAGEVPPDDPTLKRIRSHQTEWTEASPRLSEIQYPEIPHGYQQVFPPSGSPKLLSGGARYALVIDSFESIRLEFVA